MSPENEGYSTRLRQIVAEIQHGKHVGSDAGELPSDADLDLNSPANRRTEVSQFLSPRVSQRNLARSRLWR